MRDVVTQPADPSTISIFPKSTGPSLTWYRHWLQQRFEQIPSDLVKTLESNGSVDLDSGLQRPSSTATKLFLEVAKQARSQDCSLQTIYEQIKEQGLYTGDTAADTDAHRTLVFTILGWQSMLYKVAFHAAPYPQLSIERPLPGSELGSDLRTIQSQDDAKLPLDQFLYGYGQLFPPPAQDHIGDVEAGIPSSLPDTVSPLEMNWFLLNRLCNVSVAWIENVSHHMTFDHSNRVLYLFRYPSFAARCLPNMERSSNDVNTGSVLHALVQLLSEPQAFDQSLTQADRFAAPQRSMSEWPDSDDIDQMLREIILSYRLMFGQVKRSRKAFRSLQPFQDVPKALQDSFLLELCGRRSLDVSPWVTEKENYHLPDDFPILRDRISTLQELLASQHTRGFRQVWRNRQYTEQWYGFWVILIVGLLGLFLAIIQVALQAVQVALAFKALP